MDVQVNDEQRMLVSSIRSFMEAEIFPHEAEVDRTGVVPPELSERIAGRAIEMGFYAANLPVSVGGGGLTIRPGPVRAGVRQDQPRAACLDRPADRDPAGLRGRPGRALSHALRARREARAASP